MKSVLSEHCGCTFLRLGSFGNPLSDASSLLVIDNVWRLTNSSVMPDICVAWQLSTFNSSTCQQQPREHSWHVYLYYSHGNLPGCRAIPNWLTHFLSCWSKNSRRLSWTKWSVTNQDCIQNKRLLISVYYYSVCSQKETLSDFFTTFHLWYISLRELFLSYVTVPRLLTCYIWLVQYCFDHHFAKTVLESVWHVQCSRFLWNCPGL